MGILGRTSSKSTCAYCSVYVTIDKSPLRSEPLITCENAYQVLGIASRAILKSKKATPKGATDMQGLSVRALQLTPQLSYKIGREWLRRLDAFPDRRARFADNESAIYPSVSGCCARRHCTVRWAQNWAQSKRRPAAAGCGDR